MGIYWSALKRGLKKRCPKCGQGKLMVSYLKPVERCPNCNEQFGHIRADDVPPYFTIMIVGHIIVPLILLWEQVSPPPLWVHIAVWIPLTMVLTLWILPHIKGGVLGWMWSHNMSGNEQ